MMTTRRLDPVDALRGLVMVLMTLDHASSAFNAGRLAQDRASFVPGTLLPTGQFLTRFASHLCAPTFLLLAGVAVALQARRSGSSEQQVDHGLLRRGAMLLLLEVVWMSWVWRLSLRPINLEVLHAIGGSLLLLYPLRRAGPWALLLLGAAITVGHEALAALLPNAGLFGGVRIFLLAGGKLAWCSVLYPILPWAGILFIGYALGYALAEQSAPLRRPQALLAIAAALALVFLVFRALNGYGNAGLYRYGPGWIQWLHMSKYPPSLTFVCLQLALSFALLGLGFALPALPRPLVLLGQTPLFFYLLHVHLLKLPAFALGVHRQCGLGTSYAAAAAVLLLLYPACRRYHRYICK